MGKLGKILIGTAIGVGAVAAAPFTGGGSVLAFGTSIAGSLAGAGAIAAVSSVAGAGVGVAMDECEKKMRHSEIIKEKEKSFVHGMNEGGAEVFNKVSKELKTLEQQYDYIIGITAFCFYIARVDDEISREEQEELIVALNFIQNNTDLPDSVKNKLGEVQNTKYDFESIELYLDRISVENLTSFEKLIADIIYADEIIHDKEKEAIRQWEEYYARRKRA